MMKPHLWMLLFCSCALPAAEPKLTAPDGFVVERAAPTNALRFPMFAALSDNGRLFVTESSGNDLYEELQKQTRSCRISVLKDADGDGKYESINVFFENLVPSMGVAWRDGKLYVADPPNLIALEDTDNDARADKRTVILTGFGHTDNGSLHGLTFGPDGWLYMTMGSPDGFKLQRADGKIVEGKNGALLRCKPDGSDVEVICRGFENLVEIVFMPGGEIIGTDNWFSLPQDGVRDALVHLIPGAYYPLNAYRKFETNIFFSGELLPAIQMYPAVAFSGLMRHTRMANTLFSAQFNTRKIVRHQLTRSGPTFVTSDEDFLTTDDPDFHPSDVLEDRDGSILVIDTGSWYVHHCPTGRIRKTAAPGGLYRVTRKGKNRPTQETAQPPPVAEGGPFSRHKFIHDLHQTATKETLLSMLQHADAAGKSAALIVLDQSPHNALPLEAAFAALKDKDKLLRSAALESFRKHPDWMPRAVAYAKENLSPDLAELLISESEVRLAMRNAVEDPSRNVNDRIGLLKIAAKHPSKEWQPTVEYALGSKNEKLIAAALHLPVAGERALNAVAQDQTLSDAIRLEALRQLPATARAPHIEFVFKSLAPTNPATLRLAAAGLLTEKDRERFKDDPLIFPKRSPIDQQALADMEPLLQGGDENRGAQIYLGKAACSACHRVGKTGSLVGPDLTRIGRIRSGRDLIESLAAPSATFAQGYEPLTIELHSGETLHGMRVRQLDDSFVLRDAAGAETRLRPDQIKQINRNDVSLMPAGLLDGLSREEIRDLLAYLQKLK